MTDFRRRSAAQLPGKLVLLAALGLLLPAAAGAEEDSPVAACAAVSALTPAAAAEASPAIRGTVQNVRNSNGLITAVLYSDDPDTFLKRGARLDRIRVVAQQGETELCLKAPAAGRYSVALYHDENGNKEFDRDFLGIPVEGYGFSQNPGFRFRKPDIEETLFTTNGSITPLQIKILYL